MTEAGSRAVMGGDDEGGLATKGEACEDACLCADIIDPDMWPWPLTLRLDSHYNIVHLHHGTFSDGTTRSPLYHAAIKHSSLLILILGDSSGLMHHVCDIFAVAKPIGEGSYLAVVNRHDPCTVNTATPILAFSRNPPIR